MGEEPGTHALDLRVDPPEWSPVNIRPGTPAAVDTATSRCTAAVTRLVPRCSAKQPRYIGSRLCAYRPRPDEPLRSFEVGPSRRQRGAGDDGGTERDQAPACELNGASRRSHGRRRWRPTPSTSVTRCGSGRGRLLHPYDGRMRGRPRATAPSTDQRGRESAGRPALLTSIAVASAEQIVPSPRTVSRAAAALTTRLGERTALPDGQPGHAGGALVPAPDTDGAL